MFKLKSPQQEQGFTLIEVLVAILITSVFIGVAMQAMVMAAVFKVRARQFAEATTWIQEDLENVRREANNLQYTTLRVATSSTDTVLQVASIDGFQAGNTLIVGTDSTNKTIATSGVNTSARTITLTSTVRTNWPIGTVVVATTKCNRPSGTINAGFAKHFQDNLPTIINSGVKPITGKAYTLTRTATVRNTAPFDVLNLTYSVAPQSGGNPIATMDTEVIPDASFHCPTQ